MNRAHCDLSNVTDPCAAPPRERARRSRRLLCLGLIAGLVLAFPGAAAAERYTAARKFARGAANMTVGVLHIPGQIVHTVQEKGPFIGATWGFVKGVGYTVAAEVVGVFEFLTCPFETPPDFEPILKPEFPWDYLVGSR